MGQDGPQSSPFMHAKEPPWLVQDLSRSSPGEPRNRSQDHRGAARGGYAVAILATREEPTELLEDLHARYEGAEVIYVRGSVAELEDHARYVEAALAQWGRIDLLVNNAGVAPSVRNDLLEATAEASFRSSTSTCAGRTSSPSGSRTR